jgi:hypothetical protein
MALFPTRVKILIEWLFLRDLSIVNYTCKLLGYTAWVVLVRRPQEPMHSMANPSCMENTRKAEKSSMGCGLQTAGNNLQRAAWVVAYRR